MGFRRLLIAAFILLIGSTSAPALNKTGPKQKTSPAPTVSLTAVDQNPDELQVRQAIFDRVKQLLISRDYAGIDAMERDFRTGRERTPSGMPKLYELHLAIQAAFGDTNPQASCMIAGEQQPTEWEKASPQSPTAYITEAALLVKRAWCWRGDGYASKVPEDAWPKFRGNIAAAEAVLTAHRDVAAQDPQYYSVMEDIYQAEGRDRTEFESLLNEAATSEPYYYPIYYGAYYYNQPQWFGSATDVDAAARFAVERTRAKDGWGAYARYYWHASLNNCGCWKEAIDWATMKQAMRDVAVRYPEPWNLANFARIACTMNDAETAKTYFNALGQDDGTEAWQGDTAGWSQCRSLAGF
jgi:hypothetical protein